MSNQDFSYVRDKMIEEQPAPEGSKGPVAWLVQNILTPWYSAVIALIVLLFIAVVGWSVLKFGVFDAQWTMQPAYNEAGQIIAERGVDAEGQVRPQREFCADSRQNGIHPNGWFGACWPYIGSYMKLFIYGQYPDSELWRPTLCILLFFAGLIPLLMPNAPYKRENIIFLLGVVPVITFILMTGGNIHLEGFLPTGFLFEPGATKFWFDFVLTAAVVAGVAFALTTMAEGDGMASAKSIGIYALIIGAVILLCATDFGLTHVDTLQWGGLTVTLIIAVTGIVASLPIGILLALGRRSHMPLVRLVCVIFIEFWRGVPLITVLYMSKTMLPYFLNEGVEFDQFLRALIGVAMFSSAYMAEVVRGGLQAIPKGQSEGAMALGLNWGQETRMIILPQALKLVIPNIVSTFIGLFKDTTLVGIIGMFDFLNQIQTSFTEAAWATPVQALTGYLFAILVYWVFCYSMSKYAAYTERRLDTGHKR